MSKLQDFDLFCSQFLKKGQLDLRHEEKGNTKGTFLAKKGLLIKAVGVFLNGSPQGNMLLVEKKKKRPSQILSGAEY